MVVASAPLVVGLGRTQTNTPPQFEVASFKVATGPGVLSSHPIRKGGTITWHAPLFSILCYAYRLQKWQISGIKGDMLFYDIAAKADPVATEADVRLMFRGLLSDRMKLVCHRATQEITGYALVVAKAGHKLKTAGSPGGAPAMPEFLQEPPQYWEGRIASTVAGDGVLGIIGRGVSISALAEELADALQTVVVDRTGLAGRYYFGFKFESNTMPRMEPEAPSEAASVFTVLQKELGLRLEKQKVPAELLVVDHFEKPTAN